MVLQGKVEAEVKITAPADKFYNLLKSQAYQIWNYAVEGEVGTFKEKVELDDVNKAIILKGLEGEVFQYYKSFKPIFQFTQTDDGRSIAKVSNEYEKLSEEVADPNKYLRLMTNIVKDLDAYFIKA
ncbi:hypothetical protein M0R45_016660 [Rubus argutus]|uniref:Bet v I/Major latex protein domain-containing protein n=1 Tax=Rubus argutus TaxID=59490 RepID=A0AAW1XTR5_RUBAR